jgi:hypothetical protein
MRRCAKSWDRQEKTILSYSFLDKRLYFVQLLVCSNEFADSQTKIRDYNDIVAYFAIKKDFSLHFFLKYPNIDAFF